VVTSRAQCWVLHPVAVLFEVVVLTGQGILRYGRRIYPGLFEAGDEDVRSLPQEFIQSLGNPLFCLFGSLTI